MMIRLLFYGAIFYLVYRVVKALVWPRAGSGTGTGGAPRELDNVLIKDPVCGVYFPRRDGVLLKENGQDLYFCSEKCREDYIKQGKEKA